jgi:hypothetical protein
MWYKCRTIKCVIFVQFFANKERRIVWSLNSGESTRGHDTARRRLTGILERISHIGALWRPNLTETLFCQILVPAKAIRRRVIASLSVLLKVRNHRLAFFLVTSFDARVERKPRFLRALFCFVFFRPLDSNFSLLRLYPKRKSVAVQTMRRPLNSASSRPAVLVSWKAPDIPNYPTVKAACESRSGSPSRSALPLLSLID